VTVEPHKTLDQDPRAETGIKGSVDIAGQLLGVLACCASLLFNRKDAALTADR